jgi:hypothetical protein
MRACYAAALGDGEGSLEQEHFSSASVQRVLGSVTVEGFAWQRNPHPFNPGGYAKAGVLCEKHDDQLDGLVGEASAYLRNLAVIAFPRDFATSEPHRLADVRTRIDGRSFQTWFMKLICGAIASGKVESPTPLTDAYVRALFLRKPWPDQWALYVLTGTASLIADDAQVRFDFYWGHSGRAAWP